MSAEIGKNGHYEIGVDLHDPEPEEENSEDGFSGTDIYLNQIKGIKLLTREEEIALSKKIQAGQEALRILAGSPEDISKEEIDKLNRMAEEGKRAREIFIVSNLKLARSVAKKYTERGLELDDLVQEASIGLAKAVDKFDWGRGYKFSTYAYWWIKQAITRAIANHGSFVHLPVHIQTLRAKIWKEKNNFLKKYGKEPTDEELALMLGESIEHVRWAIKSYFYIRYFGETVTGDDGNELLFEQLIVDKSGQTGETAENELINKERRRIIREVFSTLTPQQRRILELRFGFDSPFAGFRTLVQVGEIVGVSRERVRQVEEEAGSILRANPRIRALARN